MPVEEQQVFLTKEYAEAIRYMDNAKEALSKAGKEDKSYYKDDKYVRTACGVAYLGVLRALDAWLKVKGVEASKKKNKSIEYYMDNTAKLDKKMTSRLNNAYGVLHLDGYYRGTTNIKAIESGFDSAYEIIEKINPNA